VSTFFDVATAIVDFVQESYWASLSLEELSIGIKEHENEVKRQNNL